jgi:hypothetical protein
LTDPEDCNALPGVKCPTGCLRCDGDAVCVECLPGKHLKIGVCTEYAELSFDPLDTTGALSTTYWAGENSSTIYV